MVEPSVESVEQRATSVLSTLQRRIDEQDIVTSIINQYTTFCKTTDAKRLNIDQRPITDEMRLRLHFECLSFCVFCASLLSPRYIKKRKWFFQRPDQQLIPLFDGALVRKLMERCQHLGVQKLREVTFVAIDPKPTFGLSKQVDPLDRLEEFRDAFAKMPGSELERFSKWIGKALDAPHYPLFEMIGAAYAKSLLPLTNAVMATVFSLEA